MHTRKPQLELPGHDDPSSHSGGSVTLLHLMRFALGAASRRRLLTTGVFLAGMLASAAYYSTRTPIYRAETKVLAQRPQALPSAVRPMFEDVPTRSAWEMIHRRENLIDLINQSGLLSSPSSPSRKDRWLQAPSAGSSGANALDAMIVRLDKSLDVTVEEGTITIRLDWPDPRQAYDVVNTALQNFLEARHLQEVTAIDEVISVLQGHTLTLRKEYEKAMDDARRRPAPVVRTPPRAKLPSQELTRLQSLMESRQRAIQDVEEFRRRRLADLHAQLDQARNTFSDAHPTVLGLRQQIEALKRESPQVENLRDEERKARREYQERLAREGVQPGPPEVASAAAAPGLAEEDQRVRDARLQFEQMDARVSAALVERDAARAAFKYRYNVIWPPQVPREPVGPNPFKLLGAGMIASFLLALVLAMAPDVLRGRVLQRWQVESLLDLPVIGDVKHK